MPTLPCFSHSKHLPPHISVTLPCPPNTGIVILMLDTKMEPAIAKEMIRGAPDTLHSEFHLEYSMLLNLLR